jgi:hypothetical protein
LFLLAGEYQFFNLSPLHHLPDRRGNGYSFIFELVIWPGFHPLAKNASERRAAYP